ncbi:hypothetical protein E2320_015802 [Naja naja]|nr:hypothetical protein E2320_015802 [Naja naja]
MRPQILLIHIFNGFCPQLSKKYGPVFTIWIGTKPMVVICGYEAVKNALVIHSEEFGGRPPVPVLHQVTKGNGLISESKKWKIMRRFILTTLRNFGMGRKSMAERISEEADRLVKKITTFEGQPFDIVPPITSMVSNVFCSVIFGNQLSYEGKTFSELLEILEAFTGFFGSPLGMVYSALPNILKFFPGPHKKVFSDCNKVCDFIRNKVDAHKNTLDPDNPRDFIDCFLLKLDKGTSVLALAISVHFDPLCWEHPEMFDPGHFLDEKGKRACPGEALADMEIFLVFAILLQHFTFELTTDAEEIDLEDLFTRCRKNRKYQHLRAIKPKVQQEIDEYMAVAPLLSSVHFDPLHWKTPEKFNPDHFLDEKGQFRKRDAFMPFSAGKRACPGEALARMELFLFFSTLLQKFTFYLDGDTKDTDVKSLFMDFQNKNQYPLIRAVKSSVDACIQ